MSEKAMRGRVCRALRPLDAISVENPVYPGTPDVNYREGWIELKYKKAWPTRENTIVQLQHYTAQQRVWLRRRYRTGGHAYLLLQVGQEFLLFGGEFAAVWVGRINQAQLRKGALRVWSGRTMDQEISHCLSRLVN